MKLSLICQIIAAALFVLSTVPKIQRPWMIGFGLTFLTLSFMPYVNRTL